MAAGLLLIVGARHHLWAAFPPATQAVASKALGAGMVLAMLVALRWLAWAQGYGSRALAVVLLIAAWYQAQALLCSLAWLAAPWDVPQGQAMCSAGLGFDLGAVGLVLLACAASYLSRLTGGEHGNNP